MKIIAENSAEDKLLKDIETMIRKNGHSNVHTQTFADSILGQVIAEEISDIHNESVKDWTPTQCVWFYNVCKELLLGPAFKEFEKEYENTVGIYSNIFRNEKIAFKKAVRDYSYFLEIKDECHRLKVDNYKKMETYLKQSLAKGNDQAIKTASTYYDKELFQYVVELNSIKIPYTYKDGKIQVDPVIYSWSDADFRFRQEFLKSDILQVLSKYKQVTEQSKTEKNLDKKIFNIKQCKNQSDEVKRKKEEYEMVR